MHNPRLRPINSYLATILDPAGHKGVRPDTNMTAASIKTLQLTQSTKANPSGAGLFVVTPHTRNDYIMCHYIWDDSTSRYVFSTNYTMNEILGESYDLFRHVGSVFCFESSTTSGGKFEVSGRFTATQVQQTPDISSLNYKQISAYSRNDVDTVLNVPVQDGIATITQPDGDGRFHRMNNLYTPVDALYTNYISSFGDPTFFQNVGVPLGILQIVPDPGNVLFSTDSLSGGFRLPPGLTGQTRIHVDVKFTTEEEEVDLAAMLLISRESAPPPSYSPTVDVGTDYRSFYVNNTELPIRQKDREFTFEINNLGNVPISNLSFAFGTAGSTNGTVTVDSVTITIDSKLPGQRGYYGPGTIVGYQGVTPGYEIAISGSAVYEAVPNSFLSRQVTTDFSHQIENPFEMELAEHFLAKGPKLNFRMIMTKKEYALFLASTKFSQVLQNEFLAEASGFTDFLSSIWHKVKPMVTAGLPILGTALGGAPGGLIGQGAGELVNMYASSLLNTDSPEWANCVSVAKDSVKRSNVSYEGDSDSYDISELSQFDPASVTARIDSAQRGESLMGTDTLNRFVLVADGSTVSATVSVLHGSYTRVNISPRKVTVLTANVGDKRAFCSVISKAEMGSDSLDSIRMSFLVAARRYASCGEPLICTMYIDSSMPFTGGSLGLAVYASLMGFCFSGLLTGALGFDDNNRLRYFYPNDIRQKLSFAASRNQQLIHTAGSEDKDLFNAMTAAKQANGQFVDFGSVEYEVPEEIEPYLKIPNATLLKQGIAAKQIAAISEARRMIKVSESGGHSVNPMVIVLELRTLNTLQATRITSLTPFKSVIRPPVNKKEKAAVKPMEDIPDDTEVPYKLGNTKGTLTYGELMSYEYVAPEEGPEKFGALKDNPDLIETKQRSVQNAINDASRWKRLISLANIVAGLKDSRTRETSTNKKRKGTRFSPKPRSVPTLSSRRQQREEAANDDFEYDF